MKLRISTIVMRELSLIYFKLKPFFTTISYNVALYTFTAESVSPRNVRRRIHCRRPRDIPPLLDSFVLLIASSLLNYNLYVCVLSFLPFPPHSYLCTYISPCVGVCMLCYVCVCLCFFIQSTRYSLIILFY